MSEDGSFKTVVCTRHAHAERFGRCDGCDAVRVVDVVSGELNGGKENSISIIITSVFAANSASLSAIKLPFFARSVYSLAAFALAFFPPAIAFKPATPFFPWGREEDGNTDVSITSLLHRRGVHNTIESRGYL